MSAIALFTKVPKASLEGLRQATAEGGLDEFLEEHGESVADYDQSGFILGTLLPYLDEQQIHLMDSQYNDLATFLCESLGITCFIFTEDHKLTYVDKLEPESFSAQTLGAYYNDFNATNDPEKEIGEAMLEGIRAFRQSLTALDPGSVVIFRIAF